MWTPLNKFPQTMNNYATAAIVGATGYTGQELLRILASHPGIRVGAATSEREAGAPVAGTKLRYAPAETVDFSGTDVVFSCLPTGESGAWALRAREAGARVVDLSADLREGQAGAVYGVPELWRDTIRARPLVANPGCYPTGVLLSLAPLLRAGVVDRSRAVIIDAASGVTGAGRSAKQELLFGEVADDYRAYGVGNGHRHVPEIAAGLARVAGGEAVEFVFTPHLLPVRRGILETLYIPAVPGVTAGDAARLVADAYAEEPFVDVLDEGLPSLRQVVGRNMLAIGFADVARVRSPLLLCVVAFDNLLKGAAGQAVQNANLMLGHPETAGVPL
jgi:N-acetyl-gamma-glutamyl-phosphate reductase